LDSFDPLQVALVLALVVATVVLGVLWRSGRRGDAA
jgi:hypothetical protein